MGIQTRVGESNSRGENSLRLNLAALCAFAGASCLSCAATREVSVQAGVAVQELSSKPCGAFAVPCQAPGSLEASQRRASPVTSVSALSLPSGAVSDLHVAPFTLFSPVHLLFFFLWLFFSFSPVA